MNSSNRRDFLTHSGQGFGALALAVMLAQEDAARAETQGVGRGGVLKALHHPPKAKRVVQLFMGGAASHIDLFAGGTACFKLCAQHRKSEGDDQWPIDALFEWRVNSCVSNAFGTQLEASCATQFSSGTEPSGGNRKRHNINRPR